MRKEGREGNLSWRRKEDREKTGDKQKGQGNIDRVTKWREERKKEKEF